MPLSHLHDLTDDVLARAARIRLACFDVDGTLTDGRLYLDSEGREQKTFHVQDGRGLVLLKRAGIDRHRVRPGDEQRMNGGGQTAAGGQGTYRESNKAKPGHAPAP